MSVPIVVRVWSVPFGCGCIMVWKETCLGSIPEGGILLGAVLCKLAEFVAVVTLHIGAVMVKMMHLYTNKAYIIIRHYADHGGCQHNMPTIACNKVLTCDSCMSIKRAHFINRLLYHHCLICQLCLFPAFPIAISIKGISSSSEEVSLFFIIFWQFLSRFLLYLNSLSLLSELQFNGATYLTLCASLPFLSFGISQSSS